MSSHPDRGLFFELSSLVSSGLEEGKALADKVHRLFFSYVILCLMIVFACWGFEAIGISWVTYAATLIMIPAAAVFFARPAFLKSYFVGSVLINFSRGGTINREWLVRIVGSFLTLISSIIYVSIWPLLILSWFDFSRQPEVFFGLVFCASGMTVIMATAGGGMGRFALQALTCTPAKLATQWLLSITKLLGVPDTIFRLLGGLLQ